MLASIIHRHTETSGHNCYWLYGVNQKRWGREIRARHVGGSLQLHTETWWCCCSQPKSDRTRPSPNRVTCPRIELSNSSFLLPLVHRDLFFPKLFSLSSNPCFPSFLGRIRTHFLSIWLQQYALCETTLLLRSGSPTGSS